MAASHSWPLVAYQPFKLIYQLYHIGTILVRLPVWLIKYSLSRSLRPHREWTFRQAVMSQLLKSVVHMNSGIAVTETLSLEPGKEKERFRIVDPFPAKFYQGPLKSEVTPVTIGGTWYSKAVRGEDLEPNAYVVFHIHGGAFVIGTGRTDEIGFMTKALIDKAGATAVFAPQYHLSGYGKQNPFPAALQDVLSSYLYLIRTQGIPARQIIVSGDSAGGNLVIAFLRYLAEFGQELDIPSPQSAVLLSPWTSPARGLGADVTFTSNPNESTDILPANFLRWGVQTYAATIPASDRYISPLGNPFATPVPIFVNLGAAEILEIDGTQWVKEMARVEGNKIESHYEPVAIHDTLLVAVAVGWEESARGVATQIGTFIRKHRDSTMVNGDRESRL